MSKNSNKDQTNIKFVVKMMNKVFAQDEKSLNQFVNGSITERAEFFLKSGVVTKAIWSWRPLIKLGLELRNVTSGASLDKTPLLKAIITSPEVLEIVTNNLDKILKVAPEFIVRNIKKPLFKAEFINKEQIAKDLIKDPAFLDFAIRAHLDS